jgi:uncharacterized membrane protein
MDLYMVVLRVVHILAGIFWVGTLLFLLGFLLPAVRATGPGGGAFMQSLLRRTRFMLAMPVAALVTTAAGVLLYYRVSDHFNSDWMGSTGGVVLSIGALAGIGAFLIGIIVVRPTTERLGRLLSDMSGQQGPPSEGQSAEMRRLQERNGRVSLYVAVLMIVSVVGMAAARYA